MNTLTKSRQGLVTYNTFFLLTEHTAFLLAYQLRD